MNRITKVELQPFEIGTKPYIRRISNIEIYSVVNGVVRPAISTNPSVMPYFIINLYSAVDHIGSNKILLTDGDGWMPVAPPNDALTQYTTLDWRFNQADRKIITKAISEYCHKINLE